MIAGLTLMAGIVGWVGLALVLSTVPWFSRPQLVARLQPYSVTFMGRSPGSRMDPNAWSVAAMLEAVRPAAAVWGERIARVIGPRTPLTARLRQAHVQVDVTEFRVRQLGWVVVGTGLGLVAAVAITAPGVVAIAMGLASGAAAFLAVEQQLVHRIERRHGLVRRELPVIAEQLGMLLASGYSLVGAAERLARRGGGATARDLSIVVARVGQGADIHHALREWSERVDVDGVRRLVAILALDRHAADLGQLVADEARSLRRDLHRDLVAQIDRRAQQVWIPVTVATLLPGAVLIGIPFSAALSGFLMA